MSDSSDTSVEESYAFDEPTPADTVVQTTDGPVIMRTGEPPIKVGGGTREEQFGSE